MKHFLIASAYAAAIVGIGMFFVYGGGEYGIGPIAGLIAAGIAFFWALVLSAFFKIARETLSEFPYFLLHLAVGLGIGAARAMSNPFVQEWHHYIYNPDALLVSCASMAAWLYVVLHVPPGKTENSGPTGKAAQFAPLILVFGVFLLPIPIVVAPVPQDPSCHNVFRGGRTSAPPSISLSIRIGESEKAELSEVYDRFAEEFGLSIRGHALLPESTQRSICNDDVLMSAGGTHLDGKHLIWFYQHVGGSGWEPLASELICRLEAKWGETLTFTGRRGQEVERAKVISRACPDMTDVAQ